uniref:NADH-ubiquinone oxidoreductase chain 3 n=1 Tax=Uroplatus ebenaui TaxID=357318 RepID=A0A0A1H7J0_9SAUR|nr:NADH dehydrogenase subunit 3 [Uroplatus ebenaui]BAP90316.1 NADH dehydrogenase subunit 3 [Uroplatus ebenaui]
MNLMIFILITLMLVSLLLMLGFLAPSLSPDNEKLSPYECGFDPSSTARLPFSIRFFLIAIMFLLFDLEIALLLPLPWAINSTTPTHTALFSLTLIIMLTLGLMYEWTQNALEWTD